MSTFKEAIEEAVLREGKRVNLKGLENIQAGYRGKIDGKNRKGHKLSTNSQKGLTTKKRELRWLNIIFIILTKHNL
ncbi:MAG: hypothetical protein Q9N34_06375 [Aquificota bacterium]|nr:hypothetical protein [Aquificota bacterium]